MNICCTAPGKLFLSGEYAVLRGAPAVVTAVDRRAVAELDGTGGTSPVVEAIRESATQRFGKPIDKIPPVRVCSPKFRIMGKKVGLGSSAAVAAAAAGALFESEGQPIETHRDAVLELAMDSHRAAQGGKGSGGDVAVSVLGGTIVFTTQGLREEVARPEMEVVAVWTGRPASTTQLMAAVDAFRARDPAAHKACFDALAEAAQVLAEAYRQGDVGRIFEGISVYRDGMDRLGSSAGVPIVTTAHKLVANLAGELGGAAKPSGAGGGDAAIAVFRDEEAAKEFRRQCLRFDMPPLDIELHAEGLRRESE